MRENIKRDTALMTDECQLVHEHQEENLPAMKPSTTSIDEYVRGTVHTNTVEGYFSVFKRGMKGVYQHCNEKHLHRYLAEFDFRYSAIASGWV